MIYIFLLHSIKPVFTLSLSITRFITGFILIGSVMDLI